MAAPHAHSSVPYTVAAIVVVCMSFGFCLLLQHQLARLSASSEHSTVTLPLARTVADLIDSVEGHARAATLRTLENSRFRAIAITVYSPDGEVYMDTQTPTDGRLPAPATTRQADVFELLRQQQLNDAKNGVRASLFRTCSPKGGYRAVTSVGAIACRCGMIVAVQACGADV